MGIATDASRLLEIIDKELLPPLRKDWKLTNTERGIIFLKTLKLREDLLRVGEIRDMEEQRKTVENIIRDYCGMNAGLHRYYSRQSENRNAYRNRPYAPVMIKASNLVYRMETKTGVDSTPVMREEEHNMSEGKKSPYWFS